MPQSILHVGLGAIGRAVVSTLLDRPAHVHISAIVDPAPQFAGKDLAAVLGHPTPYAVRIVPTVAAALPLSSSPGDEHPVAIMTTGSRMEQVRPTLEALADAGLHVVSSCEELAYPSLRYPHLAAELDAYTRRRGVAVLGTGVNPGFAMDAFALVASAACAKVRAMKITRSLDAGKRRYQLQKKVAAGMTLDQFQAELAGKRIGHVGLAESAALLAEGFGWKLTSVDENFSPVMATQRITAEHFDILPGQVRGMRMTAAGSIGNRKVVDLDLTMAFAADTFDDIAIDAAPPAPPLHLRITTGFPGDHSTIALLVNAALCVSRLQPGLRTMLDLLPLHAIGT